MSNGISSATISLCGAPRELEPLYDGDRLALLFSFDVDGSTVFFEAHWRTSAINRSFSVVIFNFGLFRQNLAGSRSASVLRAYNASEIKAVRNRLVRYFEGPEEKKFFPFAVPRSHCDGVEFFRGWIRPADEGSVVRL